MKTKAGSLKLCVPSAQFEIRFHCSDGTSYRDDMTFAEIEAAEVYAELETETSKLSFAEGPSCEVYIVGFKIFLSRVSLIH